MLVCCVIGYKVLGLFWGLKKITNKGKREREREKKSSCAGVGLYFRSTTETIRLQLSLFINYRNSCINSPPKGLRSSVLIT